MSVGFERRAADRTAASAVIRIDTIDRKNRVGVTRNLGPGGALFHSPSRFAPGERLWLFVRDHAGEHMVNARVVRTEVEPRERGSYFPNLTAVRFEASSRTVSGCI